MFITAKKPFCCARSGSLRHLRSVSAGTVQCHSLKTDDQGFRTGSATANVAAAVLALSVAVQTGPCWSAGLETPTFPSLPGLSTVASSLNNESTNKKLQDAEDAFQNSDLLRSLKEKSEANREKNKRAIEDKYCKRQAEMGVGDCGGLRYIPGMTRNGLQETPDWLQKIMGVRTPSKDEVIEQLTKDIETDRAMMRMLKSSGD